MCAPTLRISGESKRTRSQLNPSAGPPQDAIIELVLITVHGRNAEEIHPKPQNKGTADSAIESTDSTGADTFLYFLLISNSYVLFYYNGLSSSQIIFVHTTDSDDVYGAGSNRDYVFHM
nr:unnamed protein product [Haemonchus contortus]